MKLIRLPSAMPRMAAMKRCSAKNAVKKLRLTAADQLVMAPRPQDASQKKYWSTIGLPKRLPENDTRRLRTKFQDIAVKMAEIINLLAQTEFALTETALAEMNGYLGNPRAVAFNYQLKANFIADRI